MSVGWLYLAGTIAADGAATTFSRLSHGLTKPIWAVATLVAYMAVLVLFSQAIKVLPAGLAYAIWSGLGTLVIVAIGAVGFNDRLPKSSLLAIGLIIVGVAILNRNGIRTDPVAP